MNNIGTNKDLKVGDRVKIDWDVCKWLKRATNPEEVEGVIDSITEYGWFNQIRVRWDNGETNSYNTSHSDLIPVSSQKPEGSWFEKGEFPPAETVCEAEYDTLREEWDKVRVIGNDDGECVFRWLSGKGEGSISNYPDLDSFRPTQEPSKEELIVAQLKSVAPDVSEENLKLVYQACKKLIEEQEGEIL